MMSFTRPSFSCITTASNKHWGEKAWLTKANMDAVSAALQWNGRLYTACYYSNRIMCCTVKAHPHNLMYIRTNTLNTHTCTHTPHICTHTHTLVVLLRPQPIPGPSPSQQHLNDIRQPEGTRQVCQCHIPRSSSKVMVCMDGSVLQQRSQTLCAACHQ